MSDFLTEHELASHQRWRQEGERLLTAVAVEQDGESTQAAAHVREKAAKGGG